MVAEAAQCLTDTTGGGHRRLYLRLASDDNVMPFRRTLLIAPPLAVVTLLGVVPLALVFVWSFWTWDPSTYWIKPELSFAGYGAILDAGRWTVILSTLVKSFGAALLCSLLAYPLAYAIHVMSGPRVQMLLLALMTIPFFTSYLIRSFSWRLVLGRTGIINETLQALHVTSAPLDWLLFSNFAVMIGFIAPIFHSPSSRCSCPCGACRRN